MLILDEKDNAMVVIKRKTNAGIITYWSKKGWTGLKKNALTYNVDKLPEYVGGGTYSRIKSRGHYEYVSTCFMNPVAYLEEV